jgi:nitrate/TMAO reductase-like tetraheme cytochrome c subunit
MGRLTVTVLLVALASIALVGGMGWGVMTYTATPSFCNSCHVMNTRFVSWQRSPHGDVATCIECHSEPGWWGEMKAHINGARYLYVMVTGEKTGPLIRADVSDASCLRCHALDRLSDVVHNHRVLHAKHLDLGVKCSECHAGLVHGDLYGGQARPAMERCVDCHAKRRPVLVGCQSCHVQSIMPTGLLRLPR